MTYTPDIPKSGETLGGTRERINQNFQDINTAFSVNHSPLDVSTDGKHIYMQMPEQSSAPGTAANEGALYTKVTDSVTCLFWQQESSGTEVQLTTSQTPTKSTNGATFLPGGILMQWGTEDSPSTNGQVTFPTAFAAAPYSINVTIGYSSSADVTVVVSSSTPPTATTFNWRRSGSASKLYWMAIGPAS